MKVTIYTTTECQFSKQEKDYLTAHTIPFEEKNLETNREYLTEMLAVSDNFAGTPVTVIEDETNPSAPKKVLKGFTESEVAEALHISAAPATDSMTAPTAMPATEAPMPSAPVAEPSVSSPATDMMSSAAPSMSSGLTPAPTPMAETPTDMPAVTTMPSAEPEKPADLPPLDLSMSAAPVITPAAPTEPPVMTPSPMMPPAEPAPAMPAMDPMPSTPAAEPSITEPLVPPAPTTPPSSPQQTEALNSILSSLQDNIKS